MFEDLPGEGDARLDHDRATLRRIIRSLQVAQRLAHLGSWEWNLRADRLEWSDEVFRIFGLEPGLTVPDYDLFLAVVDPVDRARVDAIVKESWTSQDGRYDAEYRIRRPDGEVRHVHAMGEVTRDSDGDLTSMLGTVLDVTDRIEAAERDRARSEELAAALSRVENAAAAERRATERERAFLNSISHELRTPMTVLEGVAETLPRVQDEASRARLLEALQNHVLRLGGLVDDLLLVAEQGRSAVGGRRGHRVDELVEKALRITIGAADVDVQIDGVTEVVVDKGSVIRALHAMLDNAVRYGDGQTVELRVVAHGSDMVVEVADRGPGIPADIRDAVFSPFVRGEARVTHAPGTGVGLTVVRLCGILHGGAARITERPGGGTVVRLHLTGVIAAADTVSTGGSVSSRA